MKHNDRGKFKPTCFASWSRPEHIYTLELSFGRLGVLRLCGGRECARKKTMFNLWCSVAFMYATPMEYIITWHCDQTAIVMMTIATFACVPWMCGWWTGARARQIAKWQTRTNFERNLFAFLTILLFMNWLAPHAVTRRHSGTHPFDPNSPCCKIAMSPRVWFSSSSEK